MAAFEPPGEILSEAKDLMFEKSLGVKDGDSLGQIHSKGARGDPGCK